MVGYVKLLSDEHKGFQGLTHWLLSVFFFFLMWLVPWSFANDYINAINSSWLFAIIIFFVIGGASLLPDLDSSPLQGGGSAAIYQLGILGDLLSVLCITISGIVYSIVHTRYDEKPKSQHRMLFHTLIIPIMVYIYSNFFIPNTSDKLINNLSLDNSGLMVLAFFAGVSVYLGSNMLMYKLLKMIGKQRSTQFICLFIMLISVICILNMPYTQLKLVGTAVALGYLFHIISDLATKGSAPIFFPIPIPNGKGKFRFWIKPYLLGSRFTITTGGVLNIILNFALFGINIFLAWFIFLR